MVSYVKSFGFLHANLGVENTVGRSVVGFEGSAGRRLFMSHFFKGGDHRDGFLGVEDETACFSFGGRGGNSPNGFAKNVDSAIGCWVRRGASVTGKAGQEKVTGSAAASVGKNKVGGVGADCENHVAGVIADGGIRMRGEVVKKHVASLLGVYRR